ncbi:MAG: glycosyltransferase family 25 protein [Roseovarius sp.]|nr:glycosyltransferase family 25 protein [Roseovarius sp.]
MTYREYSAPPPIFYINLRNAKVRRKIIEKQLSSFGMSYTRIEAIDAIDICKIEYPKVVRRNWRFSRWHIDDISAAIFMSHRKVYEAILERELPVALILEDDLVFRDDFSLILKRLHNYHHGFDILRIGTFSQDRVMGKRQYLFPDVTMRRIYQEMADAGAYLVTRYACQRLLEESHFIGEHVDDFVFSPRRKLRTFQLTSPICSQYIQSENLQKLAIDMNIKISQRELLQTPSIVEKGPLLYRLKKETIRLINRAYLNSAMLYGSAEVVNGLSICANFSLPNNLKLKN